MWSGSQGEVGAGPPAATRCAAPAIHSSTAHLVTLRVRVTSPKPNPNLLLPLPLLLPLTLT